MYSFTKYIQLLSCTFTVFPSYICAPFSSINNLSTHNIHVQFLRSIFTVFTNKIYTDLENIPKCTTTLRRRVTSVWDMFCVKLTIKSSTVQAKRARIVYIKFGKISFEIILEIYYFKMVSKTYNFQKSLILTQPT